VRIIAGRWRGRSIQPPPGQKTRPTADRVREAWMSSLQFELPGTRVLDLFAGSGALGLEALSRGARHATFVEKDESAVRALRANAGALGADAECIAVVRSDAVAYARGLQAGAFDIAFADPPYRSGFGEELAGIFHEMPFARILAIEHAADSPLPGLPGARTRVYGDTAITYYTADP
jgi:16S rRNA (guanine966-N2)-methyltransferase